MRFITSMNVIPANYKKAIKKFKNPRIPEGLEILDFYWMFGTPDAIIIFNAPNEETAGEFIIQFGDVAEIKTSVAFSIQKMSWTE